MKQQILILLAVVTFTVTTSQAGWWDGHSDQDKQRIDQLEDQNKQQQQATGNWQIAAFILGLGCVGSLVLGSAIGSKGRRDANAKSN